MAQEARPHGATPLPCVPGYRAAAWLAELPNQLQLQLSSVYFGPQKGGGAHQQLLWYK